MPAVRNARSTSSRPRHADTLGMPPKAYGGGIYDPVDGLETEGDREVIFARPGPGSKGKRTTANNGKAKFNLRGVAEVLIEFGLDPIAEISKALAATRDVHDQKGEKVLDGKTGKPLQEPVLPLQERTRILMGLTEYVHPKLKSVEMTVKTPELTDAQVDARLKALLKAETKPS